MMRWGVCAAMVAAAGFWSMAAEEEQAEAPEVEVTLDVPVLSAYVWRGQVLDDEAVLEPALTVEKGGFSLNLWANMDLTDRNVDDAPQFTEVDLSASYSRQFGAVELTANYSEYLYPHQTLEEEETVDVEGHPYTTVRGIAWPGTREVYFSAGLPDLPVVPLISVTKDVDEVEGYYYNASLTYGVDLIEEKLAFEIAGSVGYASSDYNAYYFGVDNEQWNDANLGASLAYTVTEDLTITPGVQVTWLLDDEIADAADELYGDDSLVIGSLTASYTF